MKFYINLIKNKNKIKLKKKIIFFFLYSERKDRKILIKKSSSNF